MSTPNNPPLDDDSPFPWGIHEGVAMKKIPVNYFHYLWTKNNWKFREFNLVADYIKTKIPEWEKTNPGYNWK